MYIKVLYAMPPRKEGKLEGESEMSEDYFREGSSACVQGIAPANHWDSGCISRGKNKCNEEQQESYDETTYFKRLRFGTGID